jgi:alpha-methylacyl-CoA racemase
MNRVLKVNAHGPDGGYAFRRGSRSAFLLTGNTDTVRHGMSLQDHRMTGAAERPRTGPLVSLRVVEMGALGPVPLCGMMLADLGADVVRITRPGEDGPLHRFGAEVLLRGRIEAKADLKNEDDRARLLGLIASADILIEGFRPGVMERLALGPDICLARNPRLVIGRMTGWGQDGPLANRAGHDINYIALTGALGAIGQAGAPPTVPLNLIGDYGGGAMLLLAGVLSGVIESRRTGRGQVVDAAMTDGASVLMSLFYAAHAQGVWRDARQSNLLDGGAPFYRCYRCADGGYVAVGALEPQFFAELLRGLDLPADSFRQYDRTAWPDMERRLAEAFASRTRSQWSEIFEGRDACVTPVLALGEAPAHPHNAARGTFSVQGGFAQPAPAPRFSATPGSIREPVASDLSALARRWDAVKD